MVDLREFMKLREYKRREMEDELKEMEDKLREM